MERSDSLGISLNAVVGHEPAQVCRNMDGSGDWVCPSGWRVLREAPFCRYRHMSPGMVMSNCPVGFSREILPGEPEGQVCRRVNSTEWVCAPGWRQLSAAPYCERRGIDNSQQGGGAKPELDRRGRRGCTTTVSTIYTILCSP